MEKNNYNIKLDSEKLTSAEIDQHKDFDQLMNQFQGSTTPAPKPAKFTRLYYIAGAVAAALVGTLLYFNWAGNTNATEYQNTKAYLASQPYINPPLKNIEKVFGKGQVDANAGGTYTYKNGTKVHVPAAAFTDDQGNMVTGKVDIKYREYHDFIDFFVSGIPMEYDSSGVQYNLESAGMMEIYAEQGGKRLNITPGKEIQVEMVSEIMVAANDRANIPQFNVYKLDEEKRNWVYEGNDNLEVLEEDITNLLSDDTDGDGASATPETAYQSELIKIEQEENAKLAAIEATVAKPAKPVRPVKENGNEYVFNLDFADEDISFGRTANPGQAEREIDAAQQEISDLHRQYANTLWQVSTQETNFNQELVEQINWDDAKMERLNNRDYKLTLVSADNTLEVTVNPVLSATDYQNALAQFNSQYSNYEQALADRENQLAVQKKALSDRIKEERKLAKLDYDEKLAYFKAQGNEKAATDLMISNKVMNRFTVNSFGIWNCDRPLPPFIYNIQGDFVESKSNKQYRHNTAFLVDKNKNTVCRFYASDKANVIFDNQSENILWMITDENKLAMYRPEQFKEIQKQRGEHTFVMDLMDQPISSEEDLRKILTF